MIRNLALLLVAIALGVSSAALAQEPSASPQAPALGPRLPAPGGQQAPSATEVPGPTTEIVGPQGAFRLKPDGTNWERFQTVRAIGVRCAEKSCGKERVFCLIQVRVSPDAKAGEPPSQASAEEFGAGVIKTSPKEMTTDYVASFKEKTFGPNAGRWAEMKAEGEPGSLRFGLFLAEAEKHLVAFNCVSPAAKWAENRPKFENLLASLEIPK